MKKRFASYSGAIAVEFVIFFGCILVIFALALELSRVIRYEEYATLITREASSISYRDCAQDTDAIEVRECLNLVAGDICDMANNLVSGGELLISVYKMAGSVPTLVGSTAKCDPENTNLHTSKFSIEGNSIATLGANILTNQKIVVIAESFVPYNSYFPGFAAAFGLASKTIYEVSIL